MVGPFTHQGLHRGDEVADQRRMRHIAEVDDPRDPLLGIEQAVVGRQVVVDHLGSQVAEDGFHVFLEPVEHLVDRRSTGFVGDVVHQRPQRQRVLDVPEQGVSGGWVEEPAEGTAQSRARDAERIQGLHAELVGLHRSSGQQCDHPHDVRAPVGARHPGLEGALQRGDESHHRERRVGPRDMQQPLRLHVDHARVVGGVADLQHEPTAVIGRDRDVLVALADERRRDTSHTEDVRGRALGVPRRERRGWRLERVRLAGGARDVRCDVRHRSTTLDNRTSPLRAAAAVIDQEEAEAARFSSYIVAVASSIAR